ncbi:MAG: hypothetical protein Q9165_003713 [Trypethelium subeluteriae]
MDEPGASWNTPYSTVIPPAQTPKKKGAKSTKGTSQADPSKPKSSLRIRLCRSLPLLRNIVFLHLPRKPFQEALSATTKSNATNTNSGPSRHGSIKDTKSSKSTRKPQRHRYRPSTSTVSTSATKRSASHKRDISGSTHASSVQKPLPTIPGDYSKTVHTERPASSIYSPSVKDLALPAIREERSAPPSQLHLRPDSTTVLLMQNDNPFEGEANQRDSVITEAPEDSGSTHVHFADQASIVSAPAELQSMYHNSEESASTLTITSPPLSYHRSSLAPSPLRFGQVTKAAAPTPSPCEADLPTAYLALQNENAHLRTSVTELSTLHSKIQSRLPTTLRHLESENSSLRHALIQSEHRYTTLASSLTALVTPNGSSISLPISPVPTSSSPYTNPRFSTSTSDTSSSSGTLVSSRKNARSLRQHPHPLHQHQNHQLEPPPPPVPQLLQPPRTTSLRVPDVDKLLHPEAKAKYYEATSATLPERQRLVQALGRQEDDLERNRGEMRRVKARVGQAEEDMVRGIEEVRRVKREVEERGGWI